MKKLFSLVFFGILLVWGCQTKINMIDVSEFEGLSDFIASTEVFNSETKTTLTIDNRIVWSKGDKLAIFQGANIADEYQVKDGCHGKSEGSFSLVSDNNDINGDFSSGMEIPVNIAIYPYEDDVRCTDAVIANDDTETSKYTISNVTIPSNQDYVKGSFPQGTFTMIAVTESINNHNLKFKNVLGALKIQLCGECTVKSIKLIGNNNEVLAGEAEIIVYNGTDVPEITMMDGGSESIILDCGEGVRLDSSTPTDFIIAIPPVNFIRGFTLIILDADGDETSVKAAASNRINRSSILKMPILNLPIIESANNIVFEDNIIKESCVKAFDTNADGELSFEEAEAVTDLSKMELSNKTFTSFTELKYFTSVKKIPGCFFQASKLQEITLPEGLQNIGEKAFEGCKMLTSINIPETVSSIGSKAFSNCSRLSKVYITNLYKYCNISFSWTYGNAGTWGTSVPTCNGASLYLNNKMVETLVIPSDITQINAYCFNNITSIKNVIIPDGVTKIAQGAFVGCCNLDTITLPPSLNYITRYAFDGCESLSTVMISDIISWSTMQYEQYDYSANPLANGANLYLNDLLVENLVIPSDNPHISSCAFRGCNSIRTLYVEDGGTSTLGAWAFYQCKNLETVVLGEGVTTIDASFNGCENLSSITIPKSLMSIRQFAFDGCSNIRSVYITDLESWLLMDFTENSYQANPLEAGAELYLNGNRVTSIDIPDSITDIPAHAFIGCSSLNDVRIHSDVSSIGYCAFYNCSSLKNVYIEADSLDIYGQHAFDNCASLVHIYVPLGSEDIYIQAWNSVADKIVGYDYSVN